MQKRSLKNLITKADIILAIVLLVIGIASPFVLSKTNKGGEAVLKVVVDGQESGKYKLSEDFALVFAENLAPEKLELSDINISSFTGSSPEAKKQEIERISLEYFSGNEIENIVLVQDEKAEMIYATCQGQDCIKMGKIDSEGEFIACLPHKTMVYIEGQGSGTDVILK